MMHPVVSVLFGRAEARRLSLLGLIEVVPPQFWNRAVSGEGWTARHHVAHALTADSLVLDAVLNFGPDAFEALAARRLPTLEAALDKPLLALIGEASAGRAHLRTVLASLGPEDLARSVAVGGPVSPWEAPPAVSLMAYLESWAGHDSEHEQAIRAAIATQPDLSAVVHVRRMR